MKQFAVVVGVTLILGVVVAIAQRPPGFRPRPSRGPLKNRVQITTKEGYRYISANGIPKHSIGRFPNRRNPNRVSEQRYAFRVPAKPKNAKKVTWLEHGSFGVAVNGVPFDPFTAEYWRFNRNSGWRYEALSGKLDLGLDTNNAHVQPNGAYHYHGLPGGLIKRLGGGTTVLLIGWAADGFPIYANYGYIDPMDAASGTVKLTASYRVKRGIRPNGPGGQYDGTFVEDYEYVAGAGDLDECNGRFGVTGEFPDGVYYYVLTEQFPFIPRGYKGTPDQTFRRRGPRPGGRPGFPPRPPRGRPPGR
ncbi:MAG: YHYH protein [Planctomycetaceae bacterium]|jgi:hypothetical protein|nr:YHYH protein [Planctomycetaceae bacterium]MBT6157925.1 YHYH protein [Planctomycetaceae bacterium]MBT6487451.1 YHYH protein [Planctomycetaceae bacterium]MBT6495574.1 YHYH protein [Planctomycetaceae bacterium]